MKNRILIILTCLYVILSFNAFASSKLTLLCWEGYAPAKHVNDFQDYIQKKYNKKITLVVKSASSPSDFFQGLRSKEVDIISPAHNIPKSFRWPLIANKIVLPLNLKNIPNYSRINPHLLASEHVKDKFGIYGLPVVYGYYGLAYNADILMSTPKSWDIFWQPEYIGKYSISADYYEANIYITALALGYQGDDLYNYELLSKNPIFIQRLKKLAHSSASFWQGVDKKEDLKGLSLASAWGFSFNDLKQAGENWQFASPKEGTTGWIDHWLIGYSLKNDDFKKKVAEEWINFTLSDEMQLYYARTLGQYPVSNTVAQHLTEAEIKQYHLNDKNYIKKNLNLWNVLTRRQQNGFSLLWKQAKSG